MQRAGAHIINDVTGLGDADMVEAARDSGAGVIVMHMQGTPATMQIDPHYDDVVADVLRFLEERIASLTAQGLKRETMAIDPGGLVSSASRFSAQFADHRPAG